VRDAFAGQKSVDPAQVAQHLQANLPQIKETVYRENDPKSALARWGRGENLVTPGHANYREFLLHAPSQEPEPETEYLVTGAFPMTFDSKEKANDYIEKMIKLREEVPALAKKIDQFPMNLIAQDKPTPASEEDFHASHWPGVSNVLAHLRLSDRGMHSFGYPETLHIEELQSDWGQKGREEGFQGDQGKGPDEGLPKGPHVTTTEGWTDLALKRALREAAQGKYKKLTWTPGEEQADRYGLDKKFNQIHYSPDTNHLVAKGSGSYDDIDERVSPDALAGFLGKDLAAKLLDRPAMINSHPDVQGNKVHSLFGGELKVPQKGMRDFYDRMIPNRLQKLVSKLDPAAKVQLYGHKIFVPEEEGSEEGEYQKVHSLEITPKLRAAILKGLPAYADGGPVLSDEGDNYDKYTVGGKEYSRVNPKIDSPNIEKALTWALDKAARAQSMFDNSAAAQIYKQAVLDRRTEPFTEKDFNEKDLQSLARAVVRSQAEGRNYLKYEDYYPTNHGQYDDGPFPVITGAANYSLDKQGNAIVKDTYDFNNYEKYGSTNKWPRNPAEAATWLGRRALPSGVRGVPVSINIPKETLENALATGAQTPDNYNKGGSVIESAFKVISKLPR
ncbi:MAG: hypothetical protein ACR2HL_05045, partial [Methylocystis sp.]